MRKIVTTTFVTMDGVMQAPGGPQEDTSGGFAYGGWSFHYWGGIMDQIMEKFMNIPFELLLGRKTYDIFAAHWPTSKEEPVASKFNATKKYVVSHQPKELTWKNSFLVTGDVIAELQKLKEQDGPDLWVHGSGNLIQTLLAGHLVDRMVIWTFPLTVGSGKSLFAEGVPAEGWKLVDSQVSSTGVVIATYEPAGPLKVGSFV
ncbi:MAG: dihydrofolate reductase family protein [Candidatus Doudnabacteria bacterium]|nr:dihydrofolate reductase family protein [Candidatus Doudnabacteria bacterium]